MSGNGSSRAPAGTPTRSCSSTPRVSAARPDAAAVAVCAGCPVLQQCRNHGLSVREPYGVWGGLTEDDREAIYLAERKDRAAARRSDGLAAAS